MAGKRDRLNAAPLFRGVTPARLRNWTLTVPLALAALTTLGACNPDARDHVIDTVLHAPGHAAGQINHPAGPD